MNPNNNLTPEGQRLLEDVAQRHGVNFDAVMTLVDALNRGGGSQAQFSHPALGGMGQWQLGGMIMVGDMFNNNLKYRVDSLCTELSNILRNQPIYRPIPQQQNNPGVSLFVPGSQSSGSWWPAEFGNPSSSGAQNDLRYAFFPGTQRLVIQKGGNTRVFNTLNHYISGVSQQQGNDQTLSFTSQFGLVRILDLPEIVQRNEWLTNFAQVPQQQPQQQSPSQPSNNRSGSSNFHENAQLIERLAELHQKGLLTNEEFATKKAEILNRI